MGVRSNFDIYYKLWFKIEYLRCFGVARIQSSNLAINPQILCTRMLQCVQGCLWPVVPVGYGSMSQAIPTVHKLNMFPARRPVFLEP